MKGSLDKELIGLIREDDLKAFEIIFKYYYPKLCLFACGYVKDREDAEDIVKDVFMVLWSKRKEIQITISISGYLYRSVRNRSLNFIRREKLQRPMACDAAEMERLADLAQIAGRETPVNLLLIEEIEQQLSRQISLLPVRCREIYKLSRIEGLSNREIAQKLNLSYDTVKTQISRALLKLTEGMKEYLPLLLIFIIQM